MIAGILFGFVPLLIWLYLFLLHRGFWLLRERDTGPVAEPADAGTFSVQAMTSDAFTLNFTTAWVFASTTK